MTLQTTRHGVILHGFQEVTSEHQVLLQNRVVKAMVSRVQNGSKYIVYLYHIIKQLLTSVLVDMRFSKLNHIDLRFISVNMKFTV